jgi:RimJ/RimL family protein N-acetyltransferase
LEEEFGPCIDGLDPTAVFIVTLSDEPTGRVPIGMVQSYMLHDTPDYETSVGVRDAAGMDLFIGEPKLIGTGLGKEIIARFVTEIGWSSFPEAQRYMAGPSVRNVRSRRAFESAGFVYTGIGRCCGRGGSRGRNGVGTTASHLVVAPISHPVVSHPVGGAVVGHLCPQLCNFLA